MPNSIFGQQPPQNNAPIPNAQMIEMFNQFRSNLKGDPKQMVMNMLSQGKISNGQLQQVMNLAKQMQHMFK